MGVDMKVKAIYDSEIGNITRSEKNWKDVLKVAGQLYRYEFDNIVRQIVDIHPNGEFYLLVGNKVLFKKEQFEQFLAESTAI